jgi:hypothetical protein
MPVRKGTMSKDLPMGAVNYTMAGVMAKANQLGILLLLTPPVIVYAHYTGKRFWRCGRNIAVFCLPLHPDK